MGQTDIRGNFRRNLNYFMDLNGYNQLDLMRALSISSATASDYCTGKKVPRMDKIEEICDWLNINTSDLLEDKTESQEEGYYLSKETKEIAQEIAQDSDLRLLFDAARDVDAEDLKAVHALLKSLKRKERGED